MTTRSFSHRSRPEVSAAQLGMLLRRIGEARGANLAPQKGDHSKKEYFREIVECFTGSLNSWEIKNSAAKERQFIRS